MVGYPCTPWAEQRDSSTYPANVSNWTNEEENNKVGEVGTEREQEKKVQRREERETASEW